MRLLTMQCRPVGGGQTAPAAQARPLRFGEIIEYSGDPRRLRDWLERPYTVSPPQRPTEALSLANGLAGGAISPQEKHLQARRQSHFLRLPVVWGQIGAYLTGQDLIQALQRCYGVKPPDGFDSLEAERQSLAAIAQLPPAEQDQVRIAIRNRHHQAYQHALYREKRNNPYQSDAALRKRLFDYVKGRQEGKAREDWRDAYGQPIAHVALGFPPLWERLRRHAEEACLAARNKAADALFPLQYAAQLLMGVPRDLIPSGAFYRGDLEAAGPATPPPTPEASADWFAFSDQEPDSSLSGSESSSDIDSDPDLPLSFRRRPLPPIPEA